MTGDDNVVALNPAAAREASKRKLLDLVGGMLRELRPGGPPHPVRLEDTIEGDLALDSLSRVELVSRVEKAFAIRLPDALATGARTLADLLDAIERAKPRAALALTATVKPAVPPAAIVGTPDDASTLVEAFRWHLSRHPDREHVTLLDGDQTVETLTYARLWRRASEVARGLAKRGIEPADAVAIMLPTGSAFFEAFLGAMLVGAVPVPMYPPYRWSDIAEHVRGRAAILDNARARLLVTVPEALFVGRIAGAEVQGLQATLGIDDLRVPDGTIAYARSRENDTAMLQYTSGSTGDPKGVVLTHRNLLANIRVMGRAVAATSADRFVSWLPLYHDMGLIGAWLATLYYGIPLVLMPPAAFLARPARWLWAIHRYRATISAGPNFAYEIAASKIGDDELAGLDLSAWRLAFNGAEPVQAATLERFGARFGRFGFDRRALTPVYGLAESAVGLAFPPLARGPRIDRIDSQALANEARARPAAQGAATLEVVACGRPLPGHEIRIVDDRGREVAERVEGRIQFRGPSATSGYYRNPRATAQLFRDGWLDSGDLGYVADAELFLTSRAKDVIKRGGHNIHPYDVESAIGEIPGVRKGCVAVLGASDRASGTERVVIVAETARTDEAARAALRERIMAIATIRLGGPPDEIHLVPPRTILKTSSGKIRRAACRELYEKGALEAPRPAVWMQIIALAGGAAVARTRRAAHTVADFAYGVYAWTLFVLVVATCLPIVVALPRARRFAVVRAVARAFVRCLGIDVEVRGAAYLASARPAIVVVNHSSYVDAIVVAAILPRDARFAAKREFASVPLLGFALRSLGVSFVERDDAARGIEDSRQLVASVRRGETLVLFPEGTFGRAPGLRPFHLGAFAASAETGVPVVAVALGGTRSILRDHRFLPTRHAVAVDVQPPAFATGRDWSAAIRLRDQVRRSILAATGEPDLALSP